ncbi:MAG: hypothetical protein ABSG93_12065 [Solirubrobacteraceae bacterium]|jgi:hypothetical protein
MGKKKVRIRSKRLDQLDESKLALAIWLIARDLVENETAPPAPEIDGTDQPDEADEDAA